MKLLSILSAFYFLLSLQSFCKEQNNVTEVKSLSIKMTPKSFKEPTKVIYKDGSIKVYYNEKLISTHKMDEEEITSLNKALSQSPRKHWDKLWTNWRYLGGYVISVHIETAKKKYRFGGWNGCPPGFSKVFQIVGKVSKRPCFSSVDQEKERFSKQYDNIEQAMIEMKREAAEYKRKKLEREAREAKELIELEKQGKSPSGKKLKNHKPSNQFYLAPQDLTNITLIDTLTQ